MAYTDKLYHHLTPYNDWLLPNSIRLSLHNLCIALCEVSIRQWVMYQPTDSRLPNAITFSFFLNFTKCMKNCHYSFLQSEENWELTQDLYLKVFNEHIRIDFDFFFNFCYHKLGTPITKQ